MAYSFILYNNGSCQLFVDIISGIFDRNGATAFAMGNDRDGLAAVAAQREQKGVQFLVVCVDLLNDIFFSLFCRSQVHTRFHHRYIAVSLC